VCRRCRLTLLSYPYGVYGPDYYQVTDYFYDYGDDSYPGCHATYGETAAHNSPPDRGMHACQKLTDRSYLCRSWQQPSRLHGSCRASLTCPQTKAVVSMCKTAHTAIPATIGQGGDEFPPRQARWYYLHQSGYSMGRCLSAGGAFDASGTMRMPAASFARRRCPETSTAAASGLAALAPAHGIARSCGL